MFVVVLDSAALLFLSGIVLCESLTEQRFICILDILLDVGDVLVRPLQIYVRRDKLPVVMCKVRTVRITRLTKYKTDAESIHSSSLSFQIGLVYARSTSRKTLRI